MKRFIRCRGCNLRVRLDESECPYTCVCGRLVSFKGKVLQSPPPQSKPAGPCVHLGAETRRVPGTGCGKRCELKVFVCAVHGECTLGKKLNGLACCTCGAGCSEFTGTETAARSPPGPSAGP